MERSAQHFTTEDFLTIPQEMRDISQWVAWRAEQRGGKTTKIPINIATGRGAKTNDPATWASFDDAISYWDEGAGASGVGGVFSAGAGRGGAPQQLARARSIKDPGGEKGKPSGVNLAKPGCSAYSMCQQPAPILSIIPHYKTACVVFGFLAFRV